jgi:hypothetical protein
MNITPSSGYWIERIGLGAPMPDPSELLAVARHLSTGDDETQPSDARLRRAVSTAYYALFHKVLRAAAQRFMGPNQEQRAGFTVLYRSFDHRHMKMVCLALRVSTLNDRYGKLLQKDAVSQAARDFAGAFAALQDVRQLADYDPVVEFVPAQVSALIDSADAAMAAFDRIVPEELTDILALLMVRTRE